jgi:hypothetical protein
MTMDTDAPVRPLDQERLQAFLGRFAADQAATMHAATVVLGDQLGLYRALAEAGPQSADELAVATGCHPRLVREWLNAQVASAYCEHEDGRYWLTPEQAACLADTTSATFVAGGALVVSSVHKDVERAQEAFATDGAITWDEHHPYLFAGTRRFFEPAYRANLVVHWIPALDGVVDALAAGARVADVGCGNGRAVVRLAEAFPASTVTGFAVFGPASFGFGCGDRRDALEHRLRAFAEPRLKEDGTARAFSNTVAELERAAGLLRVNLQESAALEAFLLGALRHWGRRHAR